MQVLILPFFGLCTSSPTQKVVIDSPVIVLIVKYTFRPVSISSRTSTFLNITLKTFRKPIVDNELDVHFVDAHSKSYCCDYNVDIIAHPTRLDSLSLGVAELAVIKCTFYSMVSLQDLGEPFAFFP